MLPDDFFAVDDFFLDALFDALDLADEVLDFEDFDPEVLDPADLDAEDLDPDDLDPEVFVPELFDEVAFFDPFEPLVESLLPAAFFAPEVFFDDPRVDEVDLWPLTERFPPTASTAETAAPAAAPDAAPVSTSPTTSFALSYMVSKVPFDLFFFTAIISPLLSEFSKK